MAVEMLAEAGINVSRETGERLTLYVETLLRWNKKINLIGRTTTDDIWQRHIIDSAQLFRLAPLSVDWIDLGAGAGLPALIIAAMQAEKCKLSTMTVVESDQRKCAFMADVARKMGVVLSIKNTRIEAVDQTKSFDVISARALAPLTTLLSYAQPLSSQTSICLFPKGAQVDRELTEAARDWHMQVERNPSISDSGATVLKVKAFRRVL